MAVFIFDFDGTLFDSFDIALKLYNVQAKHSHYRQIQHHEIQMLKGMTIIGVANYLNIPIVKIPIVAATLKKQLSSHLAEASPYPGINSMLDDLRKHGHTVGILSSNTRKNIHLCLDQHQLGKFDFIAVTNAIFGKHVTIKHLLKKYKFSSQHVFYIGDEVRDIQAAKKSGVHAVAVTWGYNTDNLLRDNHPDFLIHEPDDLLKALG